MRSNLILFVLANRFCIEYDDEGGASALLYLTPETFYFFLTPET
jgi:hypothetical protein